MLTISGEPAANRLQIPAAFQASTGGLIELQGAGTEIAIAEGTGIASLYAVLGSDASLEIGPGCSLPSLIVHCAPGAKVKIGARCRAVGLITLHAHEPELITIGDDCLISDNLWATVSDMHSIIDIETGRRINPARPIHVGNHVWLGRNVTLLKGADIGAGSIIGTGAVVTGTIAGNALAAGSPAVVRREGVTWRHDLIPVTPAGV
ncbi:MAG: acyltransferase [Alphaproteobacteria bacterium]|nr:MAG: acyltransferase [Alphaproteobacteria bacterium]